MTETERLRNELRGVAGEFSVEDFGKYKARSSILNKLFHKGEIAFVGLKAPAKRELAHGKRRDGRPVKVYKVLKLKPPETRKQYTKKQEKVEPVEPLYVTLWKKVYPDLFVEPDFSGFTSVRRYHTIDS